MNSILVTKLHDGPRNVILHVFIEADGSGDVTDEEIISLANLIPPESGRPFFTLDKIWHDLDGFSAVLKFQYLDSDTPIWSISGNGSGHQCFKDFGGLADRSAELDGSGTVLMDTRGLITAGQTGSFVIALHKG